jgi:hypothetical protein
VFPIGLVAMGVVVATGVVVMVAVVGRVAGIVFFTVFFSFLG